MKHRFLSLVVVILLISSPIFTAAQKEQPYQQDNAITVYAYDSFVSEWGPGPAVIAGFEQSTGIKVHLVSVGNASELLRRAQLERNNSRADIILGIPNGSLGQMRDSGLFEAYVPRAMNEIFPFLHIDPDNVFIPFNYGVFSFIYDSDHIDTPPVSMQDLLDPTWKKSIILMDPRTSSVGMGLLEWSYAVYGENYISWWTALKPNILTIADSWSSGYGLFTQGEAPIVISYTTSPVYHIMAEDTDRYVSTAFEEGNALVIEGVGMLTSSKNKDGAKAFIEYLLTDAQSTIAIANVMYPANMTTELPPAFDVIAQPKKLLSIDFEILVKNQDRWLTEWVEAMSR